MSKADDYRAVEVRWIDSTSWHGWLAEDAVQSAEVSTELRSVGLLIKEDSQALFLAVGYDPSTEGTLQLVAIPRVAITKVRDLVPARKQTQAH